MFHHMVNDSYFEEKGQMNNDLTTHHLSQVTETEPVKIQMLHIIRLLKKILSGWEKSS
jgi:hypothetical protein